MFHALFLTLASVVLGEAALATIGETEPPTQRPERTVLASDTTAVAPDTAGVHAYVEALIAAADAQELDRERTWRILLHYKAGLFGEGSVVDDPKFFAAPEGNHDSRAELHATLRSFFTPALTDTAGGEKHPVCRFAARFEWLKEKLAIDETRLPVPRCEPLERFLAQVQPESATLIFPTAHMNSPASMYGHTLLTVETASKSKLLAHAINYSALTSGSNFAPVYMAKGLVGAYPGYFSILPYYAKLQEYSDVNDRDIWEYPLTLTREEVVRLVRHTYELENVYSNYFFFGENCSYGLLFLLEAARPSVRLTDRFSWWVIPLDTIRSVRKAGLVADALYRPSRSTKVQYLASSLPAESARLAFAVALGKASADQVLATPETDDEKIRTLDLAGEYLQYAHAKGELTKSEYLPRFLETLRARSSLGAGEEWRYDVPVPPRPDDGHRSNRLRLGGGAIEGRGYQEIRWRPAYHQLLDNEAGFKPGSEIVFLDVALRYVPELERVQLQEVDIIDITSLAPSSRFFRHTSWKVRTGFFRRALASGGEDLVWSLHPGVGRAWEQWPLGVCHVFLESDLELGGALRENYALGAGVGLGVIRDAGAWRGILSSSYLRYGLGDTSSVISVSLAQRVRLGTNTQITLTVGRRRDHAVSRDQIEGGLDLFF